MPGTNNEFKLELNEAQQQALEQALRKLKTGEDILKNNDRIKNFVQERKNIDSFAAKKNPVIKEYIDLHKKAETKAYTYINQMTMEMKNVAAEQEALKMAAQMCKDKEDKDGLEQAAKALDNHPAMQAYEKYIKGLKYLSGMEETLDKEIDEFFEQELRVALPVSNEFNEWRKNGLNPNAKGAEKVNQEFQKLTAPAKAREMYHKNCGLAWPGICKQFLGVRVLVGVKGIFRERMTPTLFCVAQMANQGYTIEEITNPRLFKEEKKKIGEEYLRRRESNTKEDERWYIESMYHGAEAMIKAFKEYVKDNKEELKTEEDLAMHASSLGIFSHFCFDMFQELNEIKNKVPEDFKTKKEIEDLAIKMAGYQFGDGTGSVDKITFKLTDDREPLMYFKEIQRQLYIKSFLDEIQKDEPNLDALLSTPEQFGEISDQIYAMPEFTSIFTPDLSDEDEPEAERNLDVANLNSKQIKVLSSMMSHKFLIDNDIKLNITRTPVKITSDPLKGEGFTVKEGSNLTRIVTRHGKQTFETDMPGKMSEYLHDLETKGIKGKAKDNSDEFNRLLANYGETLRKLDSTSTPNKECLSELKKLKEVAAEYINAKRAQKGYDSKTVPDATIDAQMLGKEKGGASIFTSRGKDRYEFALNLIERATTLENRLNEYEKQNPSVEKEKVETEIQNKQNDAVVKNEATDSKNLDVIEEVLEEDELGGF